MRVVPGAVLIGYLTSQLSIAAPLVTRCVDGGTDVDQTMFIPITKPLPAGFFSKALIPDLDDSGPNEIKWINNSEGIHSTTTIVAKYKGHDITEIVYDKTKDTLNDEAPFSCVVFLYTTTEQGKDESRPFFILSGEDARWFEYHLRSIKEKPLTIEIDNTSPGNGVYWTEWDFTFNDQQALITHASEGGRHAPTNEYQFSSSGKIVKTSSTDNL